MVEIDKFKVRELMAKKKIATLQDLANCLGISKTQLSNILSDKFVPIKRILGVGKSSPQLV